MSETISIQSQRRGSPPPSWIAGQTPRLDRRIESGGSLTDPRLAKLRQATGQIVGSVFYGTLLRIARDSAIQGKYGHGGYGETVFQGQLDQLLAERAGQVRQNGLSGAILKRLAPQQMRIDRSAARPHRPQEVWA